MKKGVFKQIKNISIKIILLAGFILTLVVFIAFARGYRFGTAGNLITSTGIITIGSAPKAARIYINGELKGVTDSNLTLPPNVYKIDVKKEGYTSWEKEVRLKGEIVQSFEAILFPVNPSLSPLTNLGITKALPISNSHRVLLFVDKNYDEVASPEANTAQVESNPAITIPVEDEKNGVYLFEERRQPITIFAPLKPIILKSLLPPNIDLKKTDVIYSPNLTEAIFTFYERDPIDTGEINQDTTTGNTPEVNTTPTTYSYLLSLDEQNTVPFEVTNSEEAILKAWAEEKQKEIVKVTETYPKPIQDIASEAFDIISFSPDETKILYLARQDTSIPLIINPPLIGSNPTPEVRDIQSDQIYVYDKKEDKNFHIPFNEEILNKIPLITYPEPSPTESISQTTSTLEEEGKTSFVEKYQILYRPQTISKYIRWYPSSRHIVYNEGERISVIEYDGNNKKTVYSGPYDQSFFSTSLDWKIFILANLNPQNNKFGDLYEVGIR